MSAFKADMLVSAGQLGEVLGLSERRIRQLENQGVLPKAARGKFRLGECVQAHSAHCVETEIAKAERAPSVKDTFDAERARKLKLGNDREERLLIPMEDAATALDYVLGEVRNDLAGVAARVTDDVALRRQIESAMDAVLHALDERFEKAGTALEEGRDPFAPLDSLSGG